MDFWKAHSSVHNRNNWGNWNKDWVLEAVKELLLMFLGLGMEPDYIECHYSSVSVTNVLREKEYHDYNLLLKCSA